MSQNNTPGEGAKTEVKAKKSKHRPSRTPTGLPGDEPKPPRHRRHRHKLGEVVDTLLVPEHKAARRLIRRSQKKNPNMAANNNMTLYERIIAYRMLKKKGLGAGAEGQDNGGDDDVRKLERSDTGWGSVDISQYTNKKDSDDNRSPTPPPTLSDPPDNRRKQGHDYEEKATARDVHVEVDDNLNKKEPLPPVRSATPKLKRTPTPTEEKRQSSDLNRHSVLPPINDSPQEHVKEIHDEKYETEVKKEETAVVAATAVAAARSDRREERREEETKKEEEVYKSEEKYRDESKREEEIKREEKEDVKSTRQSTEKEEREERKSINEEYKDKREEVSKEAMVAKEANSRKEDLEKKKEDIRDEREEKKYEDRKTKSRKEDDRTATPTTRTPSPKQTRQKSQQRRSSTPRQTPPPRKPETPQREPPRQRSAPQEDEPVVNKATAAAARKAPRAQRKSPDKNEPERRTPKRKTPDDDEIERLDRMVDRDLNDIINTLGKKGSNAAQNVSNTADDKLKQKIFNPSFQAEMDNYLRDI